jgi:hypothetical protein
MRTPNSLHQHKSKSSTGQHTHVKHRNNQQTKAGSWEKKNQKKTGQQGTTPYPTPKRFGSLNWRSSEDARQNRLQQSHK